MVEVRDIVGSDFGVLVGVKLRDIVGSEVGNLVGAKVRDAVDSEVVGDAEVGTLVGAEVGDYLLKSEMQYIQYSLVFVKYVFF